MKKLRAVAALAAVLLEVAAVAVGAVVVALAGVVALATAASAAPACGATVSGYVVLTGDLNCAGTDGLVVAGPRTLVNLNGYTITGDGTAGTVGIRATSGDLVLRGGTVAGFGDGIIVNAGRAVVEYVTTSANLGDGLRTEAGTQATIGNVTANANGDDGIEALGAVVDKGGNTAAGNGGTACVNVACA